MHVSSLIPWDLLGAHLLAESIVERFDRDLKRHFAHTSDDFTPDQAAAWNAKMDRLKGAALDALHDTGLRMIPTPRGDRRWRGWWYYSEITRIHEACPRVVSGGWVRRWH